MYHSDEKLKDLIEQLKKNISYLSREETKTLLKDYEWEKTSDFNILAYDFLIELKNRRAEVKHVPNMWTRMPESVGGKHVRDGIIQVICSCGHVTDYRIPLVTLEDFLCPRQGR